MAGSTRTRYMLGDRILGQASTDRNVIYRPVDVKPKRWENSGETVNMAGLTFSVSYRLSFLFFKTVHVSGIRIAQMETCRNCGSTVGELETVFLWQGNVVCGLCHSKLSRRDAPALQKAVVVAPLALAIALVFLLIFMLFARRNADHLSGAEEVSSEGISAIQQRLGVLKAENDRLKVRLTQIETSTQAHQDALRSEVPPSTVESVPSANGSAFDSPKAVVLAYISAATWEARVPCVANAATVRAKMQQTYEVTGSAGRQAVQFQPETYKRGKIQKPILQADGSFLVAVDMTGLNVDDPFEYVVVKETDGFKIDWVASRELVKRLQREKFISDWGLAGALLEVKVLKVEQASDSYTQMAIQVTNRSAALLSFWSVSASVYDGDKAFLANDETNGSNLRPGAVATEEILFHDVDSSKVASWRLRLGEMTAQKDTGDSLPDAAQFFTLREMN